MNFAESFEHSEALFQAAVQEFAAQGYEQASINAILKEAGMSKGQFYYHFKNKQGLYFALIEVLITQKQAFMAGALEPDDLKQDFFTVLKTQIELGVAFADAHPEISQFSESFLREQGRPIYDEALARFNFDNDVALHQLVESAYRRGEFREELPLPFVQRTISYLFTHTADLTAMRGIDDAEGKLLLLLDFMKNGLARKEGG